MKYNQVKWIKKCNVRPRCFQSVEAFIDADTLSTSLLLPNATLLLLYQTTFRRGLGKIFIQQPYQVLISQNHSADLLLQHARSRRGEKPDLIHCVVFNDLHQWRRVDSSPELSASRP